MTAVTVLGLGPMGQAVARALLTAGHEVTVWNRTRAKADAVPDAIAAETVDAALAEAELVVTCLRDEDALQSVIGDAQLADRTLVNVTTGTPEQSRRRAEWAAARDIAYVTGAIMTPTPLMGTDDAVVLFSGDAAAYHAYEATLAAFGGSATFLGDDPGRASAFDAALLDLFWTATMGIVHSLAFARTERITYSELEPFTPAIFAMLPGMMSRFDTELGQRQFPGEVSTIGQADAGLTHLISASESRGIDAAVLRAGHSLVCRAIEQGFAGDGLGRLGAVLEPTPGQTAQTQPHAEPNRSRAKP